MRSEAVIEQVREVVAACGSPDVGRAEITAAMRSITQVESFLASKRSELVHMLNRIPGSFPEADIADTTGCSLGQATRHTDRANTLDTADAFADALDSGAITAGHVDALTRGSRQLDDDQRQGLFDQQNELADRAAGMTISEFDQHIRRTIKSLQTEHDAADRLERQRRAVRVRSWVDDDGMWNLKGRFDPVTGKDLARRLDAATDAMFAEQTPDTTPADPIERQQHLRGLALAGIISGDAAPTRRGGDPIVVVDATQSLTTSDGATGPALDWGIPVEVPTEVLLDVLGSTSPDVVVVANGVVLHAPGRLDLGRTTRLANRAQRRALRGLYSNCAVPGCGVHYDRCKLHHIEWWRHGGATDLNNLLPVCAHHHNLIHNDGWTIALGPNRQLTIGLRDGQLLRTGPPKRSAA